jgi:hypothetical protein
VESADARPTDQSVEAFLELSGLLDVELRRLAEIVQARLPELNRMLRQTGDGGDPGPGATEGRLTQEGRRTERGGKGAELTNAGASPGRERNRDSQP